MTQTPLRSRQPPRILACTGAGDRLSASSSWPTCSRRVVENGEPFVIAQADTPHEIVPRDGYPADHQSVVVGLYFARSSSPTAISTSSRSAAIPANSCQLLLAGTRLHAGQRSGHRAVGRPAQAGRPWSRG